MPLGSNADSGKFAPPAARGNAINAFSEKMDLASNSCRLPSALDAPPTLGYASAHDGMAKSSLISFEGYELRSGSFHAQPVVSTLLNPVAGAQTPEGHMTVKTEQAMMFKAWRQTLSREWRWAIVINADPDALASAMALKRMLHTWAKGVDILRINEVTRPDNLAMIRYLRIPAKPWQPDRANLYNAFAMVDSQPAHNHEFSETKFSLIIDHHPFTNLGDSLTTDAFCDIRPGIGATSSIMTQFLRTLRLRPGPLLATALLYGIRTDTGTFERSGDEADLQAYQWLSHYADNNLLRRVSRSEYLRSWLPFFSRAFRNLVDCRGGGAYAQLNDISSADLIVAVADFFTKVHGLKWIAVSGILGKKVIVVFRGDGCRDIGRFADACFHDIGTAGGHRNMGRAEFPLAEIPDNIKPSDFIYQRLMTRKLRARPSRVIAMPEAPDNGH